MRKRWKVPLLALATVMVAGGIYLAELQETGNFHEVIPGELYRSAQPTAEEIRDYAARYGIRTVLNLRGADNSAWYKAETEAAAAEKIEHIDFRLSPTKRVTPDTMRRLVALMKAAPKPILIHCRSGSDRTGLASVLYLHEVAGVDEETAEKQLSIYYGHFSIPFLSQAYAMDESWEDLEQLLGMKS
ncbi:dual specificity protein phosphatase family protein [Rhizobium sp. CC-YZS058]|uniref:dual specificity protein phosphatase family protein n=1 Tax=Rhizobium sp. CC-YZS058 TaxID=3042153 RepID=UPI002B053A0C|nr:dual specificity protein phosphatase family protein [Rhizobium sp. CC-YZS058]MEA3536487.1 dual specificity protein phosphatase family protein [Rhizobium sp. CC-YZS058]